MRTIILLTCLLQTFILTPAQGAIITVIVDGIFSQYDDPDGLLPFAEPLPETEFKLVLRYDDTAPDTVLEIPPGSGNDLVPDVGIYNVSSSPFFWIELTVGSQSFGPLAESQILVLDDASADSGEFLDVWEADTYTETPTGVPEQVIREIFGFAVSNQSLTAPVAPLTSDSLIEPFLAGWDNADIFYSIGLSTSNSDPEVPTEYEQLALATATISNISVVPIPAAVWLFGSGLGLLGWFRRRQTA